jgi:hypothetical protein
MRFFEEPRGSKTLSNRTLSISHSPWYQPGHGFNDETGGDFSPRQHHIAHTDLTIDKMLTDSVVYPLITPTEKAEAP